MTQAERTIEAYERENRKLRGDLVRAEESVRTLEGRLISKEEHVNELIIRNHNLARELEETKAALKGAFDLNEQMRRNIELRDALERE